MDIQTQMLNSMTSKSQRIGWRGVPVQLVLELSLVVILFAVLGNPFDR
jgi:hypothetical protein